MSGDLHAAWSALSRSRTEEAVAVAVEAAQPILAKAVARKFGLGVRISGAEVWFFPSRHGPTATDDAEDLLGDCCATVVDVLTRAEPELAISKPVPYLLKLVDNRWADWIRRRYPHRHRLKQRVRALMDGTAGDLGFSVWEDRSGQTLCGFDEWSHQESCRSARRGRWQSEPRHCLSEVPSEDDGSSHSLAYLVSRVLNWVGGPLPLDEMVAGIAAIWGQDRPAEELGAPEASAAGSAVAADAVSDLAAAEQIAVIAGELEQLPQRQRAAILLAIELDELLAFIAVVGADAICQLLNATTDELAALCPALPMPDLQIAARLGLTRQQVINLRKAGRRRLVRRLSPADL
jgi:RNA polymerase sigma factor (sigma-70 family)